MGVRTGPDQTYTQEQMIEDYYAEHLAVNCKPKGAHAIRLRLLKAHKEYLQLLATRTTRGHVHDLITALADAPVAARSVRSETAAAWVHAVNAGRISQDLSNWWAQVKFNNLKSKGAMRDGKRKGTGKRILRPMELAYLFNSQMHLFSPMVQDFLTIQQWTCTRGGEICQMHASHFSEDNGIVWWTLPKELTKVDRYESGTDVRVPLIGRARTAVERRLADDVSAAVLKFSSCSLDKTSASLVGFLAFGLSADRVRLWYWHRESKMGRLQAYCGR